ncbi:hypothetical protein MKX01_032096 [Papaver californicum]|nr:hypothetical protein MKX01_032096 [Papaver californicum]
MERLAQESFEKVGALENLLYDRYSYGPYSTGDTSTSPFSSEQSQHETSLQDTFSIMGFDTPATVSRKRLANATMKNQNSFCYPDFPGVESSSNVKNPNVQDPSLEFSENENPYLNSNVDLSLDIKFMAETSDGV